MSARRDMPKRRRGVAIAFVTLTLAAAAFFIASPQPAPEVATPRSSPRSEAPMLVRLDPTTRSIAPAPEPPKIDRFDPGY